MYLHEQGVAHMDIKPQNMFVRKKGQLKLGDFGSAMMVLDLIDPLKKEIGTVHYMSPEVFRLEQVTT